MKANDEASILETMDRNVGGDDDDGVVLEKNRQDRKPED